MAKVLIIGAGGHGREVLEILRDQSANGGPEPIGFIDESPSLQGKSVSGMPVLGDCDALSKFDRADTSVIIAMGFPTVMKKLRDRIRKFDLPFARAVSPRAVVSPNAKLGEGVILFPQTFVSTAAEIGSFVTLNVGSSVSHDCRVADYCAINPGARLAGNVHLGEGTFVGMGANLIQGMRVGAWSTIGAGAAVIRNVDAGSTVVGVPARPIRSGAYPTS